MSAPVFLVEQPFDASHPGETFILDGAEGRHAAVVQRRGAGEHIDVVDGGGTRLRCVVESVADAVVTMRIVAVEQEAPPAVRLVLAQALAKGDRDEMAIEMATEVGADAVIPWQAERSIVVWRGDRAAKSRMRWLATVRAATKQSRRARVPQVDDAVDTRGLVRRVSQVVAAGGQAIVLHEDAPTPLAAITLPVKAGHRSDGHPGAGAYPIPGDHPNPGDHGAPGDDAVEVLVVVGPEGGISAGELTALTNAGAHTARLGPHVLRTSTAGPVALAIIAQHVGRWDVA